MAHVRSLSVSRTVAARIRQFRRLREWPIRRLAEECRACGAPKLTESSLTNIERGRSGGVTRGPREVTAGELMALAYALGVPPAWLLVPSGIADAVEVVPGVEMDPLRALEWITGRVPTSGGSCSRTCGPSAGRCGDAWPT